MNEYRITLVTLASLWACAAARTTQSLVWPAVGCPVGAPLGNATIEEFAGEFDLVVSTTEEGRVTAYSVARLRLAQAPDSVRADPGAALLGTTSLSFAELGLDPPASDLTSANPDDPGVWGGMMDDRIGLLIGGGWRLHSGIGLTATAMGEAGFSGTWLSARDPASDPAGFFCALRR